MVNKFSIREITPVDNVEIKNIILEVSEEYKTYDPKSNSGAGSGAGDPELNDIYSTYQELGAKYWVIEDVTNSQIVGGGGYKKLKGSEDIVEMQKLFLIPEARGHGLAKKIIELILQHAKDDGYIKMYLETASQMKEAINLYEKFDFKRLEKPLGNTGHFQCSVFMSKELKTNKHIPLKIRPAAIADTKIIIDLIKELAIYEKLEHQVNVSEELICKNLFENHHKAYCLIAEYDNQVVGFAIYFYNFSTFLGKPGLYLEDLFVKQEFRSKGIGKAFMQELARIAIAEDLGRIEWWVLDWNTPSIEFYKKLGAVPMDEWTVFRITSDKFSGLL